MLLGALFRIKIAGARPHFHARTLHLNLNAVEARLSERVGDVSELVLAMDFGGDLAQLLLEGGFRPVGVEDAARVSRVEFEQARGQRGANDLPGGDHDRYDGHWRAPNLL